MRKALQFVALSVLGILIYSPPAGAQLTGGPPIGPHVQIQLPPPPPPPSTETSSIAVVAVTQRALIGSARIALSGWMPSLLRVVPPAIAARRRN